MLSSGCRLENIGEFKYFWDQIFILDQFVHHKIYYSIPRLVAEHFPKLESAGSVQRTVKDGAVIQSVGVRRAFEKKSNLAVAISRISQNNLRS